MILHFYKKSKALWINSIFVESFKLQCRGFSNICEEIMLRDVIRRIIWTTTSPWLHRASTWSYRIIPSFRMKHAIVLNEIHISSELSFITHSGKSIESRLNCMVFLLPVWDKECSYKFWQVLFVVCPRIVTQLYVVAW